MSFWFDQKHKEYAADGRESWIRAYVDRLFGLSGEAVTQEMEERKRADTVTRDALDLERTTRKSLYESLQQELTEETSQRVAAVQQMKNEIFLESQTREGADERVEEKLKAEKETLLQEVDKERADRVQADAGLDGRIKWQEKLNQVYDADAGQFGSDNNVLAITIDGVSAYTDLEGKTVRVNTLAYSNTNSEPANVYLNINHLGNQAIRRPVPALQTGYDSKQYYTDLFYAREINRNTIMELTFRGGSVIWNNPTGPARATAQQLDEGVDDASYVTPKLAAERFQTKEAAGNITKNPADSTGDLIDTHLTVGRRINNSAIGRNSFSSGNANLVSGLYASVAGGESNTATAQSAFAAGGEQNAAKGSCSFVCGQQATAKGIASFVGGGQNNTADGTLSGILAGTENSAKGFCPAITGGEFNILNGRSTCIAGGGFHEVTGDYAFVGGGNYNIAHNYNTVFGRYCTEPEAGEYSGIEGDALVVGIGEEEARSNGFRVSYAGDAYFKAAVNSTGADYAEMWEWLDGNPAGDDRVGRFVAMEGSQVRFANADDPCARLGVVSARPSVVGDSFCDEWCGKYATDIYGRWLTEHKTYDAVVDEAGEVVRPAYEADEYVISPDYDPSRPYIPRNKRPEWTYVGTHGKLVVIDDGSCVPGGYCMSNDEGCATASDQGFYVMARLDETHIRIYVR